MGWENLTVDTGQLSAGVAGLGRAGGMERQASGGGFRLTLVCGGCIFVFVICAVDHLPLFFQPAAAMSWIFYQL